MSEEPISGNIKRISEDAVRERTSFKSIERGLRHFFQIFRDPVGYFREMRLRKSPMMEFISAFFNMLVPIAAAFMGSLTLVWRVYSYGKKDQVLTAFWGENLFYILIAMAIIGTPSLIQCLKANLRGNFTDAPNKGISRLQLWLFTLRQWFAQFIPLTIGFTLTFLSLLIEEVWHIERFFTYFMVVVHLFLIWQCIIFGAVRYSQTGDEKRAFLFSLSIFIGIIVVEQIIAIAFNDIIWEHWTIPTMWRKWVQRGVFE